MWGMKPLVFVDRWKKFSKLDHSHITNLESPKSSCHHVPLTFYWENLEQQFPNPVSQTLPCHSWSFLHMYKGDFERLCKEMRPWVTDKTADSKHELNMLLLKSLTFHLTDLLSIDRPGKKQKRGVFTWRNYWTIGENNGDSPGGAGFIPSMIAFFPMTSLRKP